MFDTFIANGAVWFTASAILGTGVFLVRLLVLLAGGTDDTHLSDGADPAGGDAHAHDGLAGVLTIQGAAAFGMGFGWAGLLGRTGFEFGAAGSIALGMVGGIGMLALLAFLIRGVRGMQSSGNFQIARTVGLLGEVYAEVPAPGAGRGQVRVVVQGRQRIVQAFAETGQSTIPTGSRVKVVKVGSDNTVVVEKV
ncbi:MAG: hypothetical protein ACKVZJ_10985 [Phycisphaerales bacterium]